MIDGFGHMGGLHMGIDSRLRWWHLGLLGGFTLSVLTAERVVIAVLTGRVAWADVIVLPLELFGIGFICGLVASWLRNLSEWFGWVGDAVIGAAVTNVFFAACAILFDDQRDSGMHVVATGIGGTAGILFGWDWRREVAKERRSRVGCHESDQSF